MKIKARDIWEFLLCLFSYSIIAQRGYFKYVYVLFLALVLLMRARFVVPSKYFIVLLPALSYVLMGLSTAVLEEQISFFSFKMICFLLIPPIAAISFYNTIDCSNCSKYIDMQFWSISIIQLSIVTQGIDIKLEAFESQYAFIFGVYAVYYLCKKKYNYLIASVCFTILAYKRIAAFAMALAIFMVCVLKILRLKKIRKFILQCMTVAAFVVCYLWIALIRVGWIRKIMLRYNINPNGRLDMWDIIKSQYSFSLSFLGKGAGYVLHMLDQLKIPVFANLHNDILVIYIELGFIGMGIYLIAHFYLAYKAERQANSGFIRKTFIVIFILYTLIIYLTDNIMIYINYWLPASLMILSALFDKSWEEVNKHKAFKVPTVKLRLRKSVRKNLNLLA